MQCRPQFLNSYDKGKEMIKAETEAGDIGPIVTEVDI